MEIRGGCSGEWLLCIPTCVLCIRCANENWHMLLVRWCCIICFLFTPLKPLPYYILCYLNDTNIHFQETSFKERQKYVIQVDASFAVQKTNILLTYIHGLFSLKLLIAMENPIQFMIWNDLGWYGFNILSNN